jgi:hypothetical protein
MRAPLPAGKDSAKSVAARGIINSIKITDKYARIDIFIENLPFHSRNPAKYNVFLHGVHACAEYSQDAVDLFVSVYPLPVPHERL